MVRRTISAFAITLSFALTAAVSASAADAPKVVKIVAGDPQSCALMVSGDLYCWSVARMTEPHFAPATQRIAGLPPLKDFDLGWNATDCGIDMNGAPVCWRAVFDDIGGEYKPTRIFVPAIEPGHRLIHVAVGFSHACVLDEAGGVWCMGDNADGELGTGDTESHNDLTKVAALPPVATVDTGVNNTCAVTRQGDAWCWGTDTPILDHPMIVGSKVPVQVQGPKSLLDVHDGRNSMCAISSEPSVYCWGDDIMGQLGVPNSDLKGRIFAVIDQPLDQPAISISSGAFNTCIVMKDGSVRCWGAWDGDGSTMRKIYTPETKPLPRPALSVSLSSDNDKACALLDDNTVWCWGYHRTADTKAGEFPPYVDDPWQVALPQD